MRQHSVLVPALAAFWAACSSTSTGSLSDGSTGPSQASAFVSLQISLGGADCVDCWRKMGVAAPDTLVLEDAAGLEKFTLTAEEYQPIVDTATSPAFAAALEDTLSRRCPPAFDADVSVTVVRKDGQQTANAAGGCLDRDRKPEHPYLTVLNRLVALRKKYLQCPPVKGLVWDPQKPPPVRMLCFACGGEC